MEPATSGPKYTTVGSIYNPNAVQLQPPTRRGRSAKWPLQSSLFISRSPLFGLSSLPASLCSPIPEDQSIQYSPLQQNYDRAVSPTTLGRTNSTPIRMVEPLGRSAAVISASGSPPSQASEMEDVEDTACNDGNNLKHMSVKSLTNLASYPNPMQKNAQNMLSRARAVHVAVPNLRAFRSDALTVETILQSDGTNDQEIQQSSGTSTYSTILAKGLGAPQPLTAGPPGFRPHRPTTHEAAQTNKEGILESTSPPQGNSHYSASLPLRYAPAGTLSSTSIRSTFSTTKGISSNISDTLTADEALKYYPRGLPSNFNHRTKYIPPAGESCYPLEKSGLYRIYSQKDPWEHQAKVDSLYYAGNEMLSKSVNDAIMDKNHHDLECSMGNTIESTRLSMGKKIYPKLTIQEANAIPTYQHAVPLVSMTFQTLINHPEFSTPGTLPKFEFDNF
ncbi:hypothetical protein BX600DRAFT_437307 [Xylariales sp. PMI_506]|nr:hypothetical protein BX600DRAFT_437307 [Xylariales sp. PMI_506]